MPSSPGERLTRTCVGTPVHRWCLKWRTLLLHARSVLLLLLVLLLVLMTAPEVKPEDHEQEEPNRPADGGTNNHRKIIGTSTLSLECTLSSIT